MPRGFLGARLIARLVTMVAVVGGLVTVATPPASADVWTVTLSASNTTPQAGESVTLTAVTNQDVGPTPWYISIYDHDAGTMLTICGYGYTCAVDVTQSVPGPHNYIAYVGSSDGGDPPSTVVAVSNIVTVTWGAGVPPTNAEAVVLTADRPAATLGETVRLTATITGDADYYNDYVMVFDQTARAFVNYCYGTTSCPVDVAEYNAGTHTYGAYVTWYYDPYSEPPYGTEATSNPATVTWVAQQAPSITLVATPPVQTAGSTVTLTAQSANDPNTGSNYILVFDRASHALVGSCYGTSTCSFGVVEYTTGVHTYTAYVTTYADTYNDPPGGTIATSNDAVAAWFEQPQAPLAVALTANPPATTVGSTVTLTATATETRGGYVEIFRTDGTLLNACTSASCTVTETSSSDTTRQYVAYVTPYYDSGYAPPSALAQSNPATATWVTPPAVHPSPSTFSSQCDAGTQVVENTTEGVHLKLYLRHVSDTRMDVCVRAEDGSQTGVGGQFVITPTVPIVGLGNVGVPSNDTNADSCTTTTSPANQVPGAHPIDSGSVAGTPFLLDAYANGSAVWVCVRVGAERHRVVVPISVPSPTVNPGTQVQFFPDPGTL